MPPRRVIGIDAGGTKLLGGVVDEELVVHHRVHRTWRGADRQETLDIIVEAVEEVRAAAPDVEAVGFGIPSLVDPAGMSVWSNHLPLDDVPFRDLMSERLGLPVAVDNDANVALLAEHRHGAARGADHAVMLALGTGIGGGLLLDGQLYRGARGSAASSATWWWTIDGADCPGDCPGRGCLEVLASGHGDRARRARRRRGASPARRSGGGWPRAGRSPAALVTELAHDGDEQARAVLARVGRRLGAGLVGWSTSSTPRSW